jgi:hypothetical protein
MLARENRSTRGGGGPGLIPFCPRQIGHTLTWGSNQGLRGQSPTTNHQSHGTAVRICQFIMAPVCGQSPDYDKGLFFGRCASTVDVLEHAVCRQQRRGGVCYVPEAVDIIYSDACVSQTSTHRDRRRPRHCTSLQHYAKCPVERDGA